MDGTALREWTRTNVQRAPKADSSAEHTNVELGERVSSAELPRAPIGKAFGRKGRPSSGKSSDEHTNVEVTGVEVGTDVGTNPGETGTDVGTNPGEPGTDVGTNPGERPTDVGTNPGEKTSPVAARRALGKKHRQGRRSKSETSENTQVQGEQGQKGARTMVEFTPESSTHTDTGSFRIVEYDDYEGPITSGLIIANRYRLDKQIGTGGFGVVFDAFDMEEQQRVAVKLLSPALAKDRRTLTRFRREAIAASRVRHPGIVNIIDFGIGDDEFSYIVMEFLSGQDLEALLGDEGMVEPKRALRIAIHCARALAAAHAQGVYHRDLKPANIFLIKDEDDNEQIKIIDFGIAKDKNSNPRTGHLTSASKVVGTPYYMSPEQARGKELDGRADLYSLGVILFEVLTGRRPFEGSTAFDILMAHSKKERTRPSELKSSLAGVKGLDELVLKAIAVKRDDRYDSMKDFAQALEECLSFAETGRMHTEVSTQTGTTAQPIVAGWRARTVVTQPGYVKERERKQRKVRLWTAALPAVVLIAALIFLLSSGDDSQASQPVQDALGIEAMDTPIPASTRPLAQPPGEAANEELALDEQAEDPDGLAPTEQADGVPDLELEPADMAEILDEPEPTVEPDATENAHKEQSKSTRKRPHKKRRRNKKRKKPRGIAEW